MWVCGRSFAGVAGLNPVGVMDLCCVLSDGGFCDGLITSPEEFYRLCCIVVCDLETLRIRRPWPALGRNATGMKKMQCRYTSCIISQFVKRLLMYTTACYRKVTHRSVKS